MSRGPTPPSRKEMSRLFMSYLQDAARVRLEIAPFESDQEFERKGGTTIYAVDTNIVLLFTSPSTTGVHDRYSIVFSDDEAEYAAALGKALSTFIFWQLPSGNRSLALLIGHAAETRTLFNELTRHLDQDIEGLAAERLELRRIVSLLAVEPNGDKRLELLQQHAPTLSQYLCYDSGADAQMRRFGQLLRDGRIRRFTSLIDEPGFFSPDGARNSYLKRLFSVPDSIRDQIEESRYKLDWEDRFRASGQRGRNRRADATALARLELLNRRAVDTEVKIVLITGDQTMAKIAEDHYPFGQQGGSFAKLFIRHPRAFLSAPQILTPGSPSSTVERDSPKLIIEWLDTLLARYTADEGIIHRKLLALIEDDVDATKAVYNEIDAALRLDPNAPITVREEWRRHARSVAGVHSLTGTPGKQELLSLLEAGDTATMDEGLTALVSELTKRTEKTWEVFMDAVVRAGFDLTLAENDWSARPRRNAPPVIFDSFTSATEFCKLVLTSRGLQGLDPQEFNRKLAPLQNEDPTGYTKLLAFAVVFAQAGRWHVAGLLASRAITIAEHLGSARGHDATLVPKSARVISGREAYYLRAVCLRFKARTLPDFGGIDRLIDKAELAYQRDRSRNPSLTNSGFRFSAERISLKLNRCLLQFFEHKEAERSHIMSEARSVLYELDRLATDLRDISRSWVKAVVERNVLTNLYLMLTVVETECGPSKALDDIGRMHFTDYMDNVRAGDPEKQGFPATWLVTAVSWHTIAQFGKPDKRVRADASEEVMRLEHLMTNDPDSILVGPYDRRRFELLIGLAKAGLGLK